MRYLLDFDGVIFNTEALKGRMSALHLEEAERSASLFDELTAHDPHFDATLLVYPDAYAFLLRHRTACDIVSSYISSNPLNNQAEDVQELYQRRKIEISGVMDIVGDDRVHIVGASKSQALQMLKDACTERQEACLFIDDRKVYVEEALQLGIKAVLMDRYTQMDEADDSFVRVRSFDDVEQLHI